MMPLAAVHVHGVADALTAALGQVVLEDRRQHRGFFPQVHGVGGEHARAVHQPGVAADACQGFLDTFEGRQRHIELLTYLGVLAGDQAGELGGAGADGGQGDRAADREAVHQHHPAFAEHLLATDQEFQGDEYVLAGVGAVHERGAEGQVTAADFHAGGIGGNQCQADAQVFFFAQQVIRVMGLEGQAQQSRDRAEGDVAFFPVQAQAQGFLAFPFAFADHPGVGHGAGVGAGQRTGQGEAGDVVAAGQARQVVVALFVRAVMQEQFGRAKGVGDHYGGGQVAAAGGEFHRDLGVGVGGKALAAVFLGNDQREETMGLDVLPGSGWQVHGLADFPIADHGAEFFGRAVDKCLFFFGQLGLGVGQQLVPVGATAEQLTVPPHGAGIDGIAFGFRHRRQDFLKPAEQRLGEVLATQVRQQQGRGHDCDQYPEDQQQPTRCVTPGTHRQQVDGDHAQGGQGCGTAVCQVGNADHQNQYPQQQHIQSSVKPGAKPTRSLVGI